MHHLSTVIAARRHHIAAPLCADGCRVIRLTVDTASSARLRQLHMRVCGEALEFMRIAVCAGGERVDVWLCVRLSCVPLLTDTIRSQLPGARLGASA
jgi:hypothetical protein